MSRDPEWCSPKIPAGQAVSAGRNKYCLGTVEEDRLKLVSISFLCILV